MVASYWSYGDFVSHLKVNYSRKVIQMYPLKLTLLPVKMSFNVTAFPGPIKVLPSILGVDVTTPIPPRSGAVSNLAKVGLKELLPPLTTVFGGVVLCRTGA